MRKHSDEITEQVAKNIREARNKTGMSQMELATRIGVDPDTVRNWESCRRRVDNESLLMLSRELGFSWRWFYGEPVDSVNLAESEIRVNREIWASCVPFYEAALKVNPNLPALPAYLKHF